MPTRLPFLALFLGLALLEVSPAFAQENPALTFPFKQNIVFEPYPDSGQKIINDLLQHIADGNNRLRSSVAYVLEGQISLRWDKGENGLPRISLSLKEVKVSGDTSYRGFSLEKVLLPDLVQFSLFIAEPGGKEVVRKAISDLPVNGRQVFFKQEIQAAHNQNGLIVTLERIKFGYSEAAYHRLDDWFGYLEAYYEAGRKLEGIGKELAKLDFSDPATLIMDEFSLCEAERELGSLSNKGFFKNLGPQAGDPERVFETYYIIAERTQSLRNEFNTRMVVVDSLLVERGLVLLAEGQTKAARERFESALVLNPFYVPAHLALAGLDLEGEQKNKAITRLGEVFALMNPQGEWRAASEAITDSVMARYFREAFNFNREGRFKESLDLLAPLEAFCETVEGDYDCPYELEFRLKQTHMGMYRSFLVVGGRALRNDNLSLCRTYVSSALEYQRNNQRFIPDAGEALEVLQQCVYRYIEIAGDRFAVGTYQQAAESLEAALELCSQNPGLLCPADLRQRQQMAQGMQETRYHSSGTSVSSRAEQPFVSTRRTFVQPANEMLEQISQGQFLAWAGKTDEAKAVEEQLLLTIEQLSLSSDERILTEIERLGIMIREKECELADREINILVNRGMRYLEFLEYRLAYETGNKIKAMIDTHPQCHLPANDSLTRLLGLGPVNKYLDLMEAAASIYAEAAPQQYPDFLSKYHEAEMLYRGQNLDQEGMTHLDLLSFISASGNEELAKAGVLFMAERAATYAEETLSLLWLLKGQGLSANNTRSLQELAGRKLALWYHSGGTATQPEVLVYSLTRRDSWFRFFEQAFIRNWN